MLARRKAPHLTVIGFLLLGTIGCGGGTPTSGEALKEGSDTSVRQKKMLEGYKEKMQRPKGQAKAKT